MWGAVLKLGRYAPQLIKYIGASLVMYVGGEATTKVLDGTQKVVSEITRPIGAIFGYDPQGATNDARSFVVTCGIVFATLAYLIGKLTKS